MLKRTLTLLFVCFLAFNMLAHADDKNSLEGQGGIGIQVGGEATMGGHGFFYFDNQMLIGTHFGFTFDAGTDKEPSTTSILFAPYFNYYFMRLTNTLWLFGQACFQINTGSHSEYDPNRAEYVATTSTSTALNVNTGAEWRITKSTSIFGGFKFLHFNLDPSRFIVGLGGPFLGVNWVVF